MGGIDQHMEAMLCQVSGLVDGARDFNNVPNPIFGGDWDKVASEAACYRTQKQRFLSHLIAYHGTITNASGGPADQWVALLTALGLPTVVGVPPTAGTFTNLIDMNQQADQALYNLLALVAIRTYCCVNVLDAQQANPSGAAGAVASYGNYEQIARAVSCRLLEGLGLYITHKADDSELFVSDTTLNYFARPPGYYSRVPPIIFVERESERVQVRRTQPAGGAADYALVIPDQVTVEVTLGFEVLFVNDPRCGCDWPTHLCGAPGKVAGSNGRPLGEGAHTGGGKAASPMSRP